MIEERKNGRRVILISRLVRSSISTRIAYIQQFSPSTVEEKQELSQELSQYWIGWKIKQNREAHEVTLTLDGLRWMCSMRWMHSFLKYIQRKNEMRITLWNLNRFIERHHFRVQGGVVRHRRWIQIVHLEEIGAWNDQKTYNTKMFHKIIRNDRSFCLISGLYILEFDSDFRKRAALCISKNRCWFKKRKGKTDLGIQHDGSYLKYILLTILNSNLQNTR